LGFCHAGSLKGSPNIFKPDVARFSKRIPGEFKENARHNSGTTRPTRVAAFLSTIKAGLANQAIIAGEFPCASKNLFVLGQK